MKKLLVYQNADGDTLGDMAKCLIMNGTHGFEVGLGRLVFRVEEENAEALKYNIWNLLSDNNIKFGTICLKD